MESPKRDEFDLFISYANADDRGAHAGKVSALHRGDQGRLPAGHGHAAAGLLRYRRDPVDGRLGGADPHRPAAVEDDGGHPLAQLLRQRLLPQGMGDLRRDRAGPGTARRGDLADLRDPAPGVRDRSCGGAAPALDQGSEAPAVHRVAAVLARGGGGARAAGRPPQARRLARPDRRAAAPRRHPGHNAPHRAACRASTSSAGATRCMRSCTTCSRARSARSRRCTASPASARACWRSPTPGATASAIPAAGS